MNATLPLKLGQAEMLAMVVAFSKDYPRCTLEIDTAELLILLDTIRAAIEQPDYPEYSRKLMLGLVSKLLRHFEPSPALATWMRTSWAASAKVGATGSLVPIEPAKR